MENKVKIINRNKFDVGIKLMDGLRQINIKPNSFVILDEQEVYYLNSISSLFTRGFLDIESDEIKINIGLMEKNPNVLTDDEIIQILKGNKTKMEEQLSKIVEPHMIDRVFQVAKTLDLSASKLKFVEKMLGRPIDFDELKVSEEK